MRGLTAAPELDGWAITERLLKDLARLEDRIWLVIDDVHELGPTEALAHRRRDHIQPVRAGHAVIRTSPTAACSQGSNSVKPDRDGIYISVG